eukprot:TRINITY_DN5391_c0_g3_i1.p1 TRINITY_DN5391_c0_g3~~TRINITY_DN5391_c0_g3_i1.p1  ORF type:complete len:614 (-),score=210.75 TRINITY_DN5391_c0_g3_i1:1019-2860(-)
MAELKFEELKSPPAVGEQKSLVRFAFQLLLEIDSKSDIFHQYLQFEMAGENLEFRREVHNFKDATKAKKKNARAIFDEFVKDNAPRMINISADCRRKITDKIAKMDSADRNVFDEAVGEVDLMLVQGPFPRFANKISDIVEETWRKVIEKLSASEVGKILFMNWFMKNPEVMPLFKKDMGKHGAMLVGMIESAVGCLSDLKKLVPKLAKLGTRHLRYGAQKRYFVTLQEALVQTLEEVLEEEFTPNVRLAWTTTFQMMTGIMNAAMDRAAEMDSSNSERSSHAENIAKSETFVLMRILYQNPSLIESLEVYYTPEEIACWGALYDFDVAIRNKDRLLEFEESKTTAVKIRDDFFQAGSKVKLPASVKLELEKKLESAQTVPDLEVVFDGVWEALESRLEKRPFPIFKVAVGVNIQDTWDKITEKLSTDKLGKILFMNFFQQESAVMPLFKMDITKHGSMLAGLMDVTVKSLSSMKELVAHLLLLGAKHNKYGARPEWFPAFGRAMIQTFQDCLKDRFTEDCEKSWNVVFAIISGAMLTGMEYGDDQSDVESTGSSGKDHTGRSTVSGSEFFPPEETKSTSPSLKQKMLSSGSLESSLKHEKKRKEKNSNCTVS